MPTWTAANSTHISLRWVRSVVQIVGYETAPGGETDHATLLLATDGEVTRESLEPGVALDFALADRHCAGSVDSDAHVVCQNDDAPYCDRHRSRWPCARCTGECDMPIEACHEEHAIYLAAFAPDLVKVGVTRSWRLDHRLREQGADRAAHLRTVANGRTARQIEAEIAVDLGDRVRVPAKIRGLDTDLDLGAWQRLLADFDVIETFAFDYGLDLTERPMAETIAAGTVVGTKGRVLVLERAGSTYAVDMRDLVGYDVSEGRDDRDLQASLGAFD
jgi:hypothetical protein